MKVNVLHENMHRFKTKNLNEGAGDILWLTRNIGNITQLLDPNTTPEEKVRIGKEIKADGEKENMWGKTYTAMERLEGALENASALLPLLKKGLKVAKIDPTTANPLNLADASSLLKSILGPVNITHILNAIAKLARNVGARVIKN